MGCLNSVKPRILEVLKIVFTVIGIGFLVWGLVDIPWDDISNAGKVFFAIGGGLLVLGLLVLFVLMCLRIGNKINETKNSAGKCLCITMLVFDVSGLIIFIIAEIIICINMNDKDEEYRDSLYDNGYRERRRRWKGKYSNEEWWSTACSLTAAEIALILNIIITDYLIKVIWAKTNLSYGEYTKQNPTEITTTVNNEEAGYTKSINVFNTPPQYNQNVLNFIGYDKDGHPIYSGTNQYFTQVSVPNANAQNGGGK